MREPVIKEKILKPSNAPYQTPAQTAAQQS
jgi:hypothetical protein